MGDDVISVKNQYYILSTSSLADDRTRVLKHGDSFAVSDRRGDFDPFAQGAQGLYHHETRFLSQWVLRLGGERPVLLSSAVRDDNGLLAVDLTNPDMQAGDGGLVPRGSLHISRRRFLWQGTQYEKLKIANYSLNKVEVTLSVQFGADFADIFEVRGQKRQRRGEFRNGSTENGAIALCYKGLDGVVRRTRVQCSHGAHATTPSTLAFAVSLAPHEDQTHFLTVSCDLGDQASRPSDYATARDEATGSIRAVKERVPGIFSSNEQLNDWLKRSTADIRMMMTETPHGLYPYAGVPWFNTPFGRDGIVTAMEALWLNPAMARGVLSYLAATQATSSIPESDAEPGKILHETRQGEMAVLNEVPFRCYYGSVDATPLFVLLAGRYYRRTGDRDFMASIWTPIERALHWIDRYGDADGDGFVEYARRTPTGLVQQGWKDSSDSVFHNDGRIAEGPIALCEVQGYVYAAKQGAAEIARALDFPKRADDLREEARQLREHFEQAFWCEDLSTYALALDGKKQPCRVRASNAGHCLFTGIAGQERAERVARILLEADSFSGWGIRTLSASEARFNPMSYHNGSIWPHDNALIAAGMSRYGFKSAAARILSSLLDASIFVRLHRLPELYCGFDRRPGEGPTLYPVACSPQSWAAASVFLVLESCLGMSIDAREQRVSFTRPFLPESIQKLRIGNLQVGDAVIDLSIRRAGDTAAVTVSRRLGNVEVLRRE
ncbi:MAG TPA: amylo-alpha-1,6-glucosidase [Terriglobia bacterium]|nr:amylo-alpha-1,6-glucosidase [Terriglobia bacterium]